MKLLVLTITLLGSVSSWDCYDQECWGTGLYDDTWITCDQSYQHCGTSYNGYPQCQIGYSGNGTWCYGDYYCSSYSYDGRAYCSSYNNDSYYIGPGVGSFIFLAIVILCCCRCCRRRRQAALQQQTVVIQQNAPAPVVSPAVIQNINVVAPAPPANYGATAYPAQPGGYPSQPGGYPAQPSGYPAQQGGYPAQPGGYPAQPSGYPAQQGGYPVQPGGYPAQPGGYPAQPGGYPAQQQPGHFAEQPPPYDANAPPKNEYSTNPNYQGP